MADVAQEAKAVLVGPMSRRNASVATRNMVFSLTRPYEDMLLAPFQAIRQKGVATVSYIGPSERRAESLSLEENFRTCQVLSQTAERSELVFLRGEELDDVSADSWSTQVADAVQRLVTPRPDVIVCCDSSYVCITEILNAIRRIPYDIKGFIILDDQHLTLALNRATVDVWATTTQDVVLWLQARMLEMGRHQTLAEVDAWATLSYYTMTPWTGTNAWTNELVEMMKDCLVVSSWNRNSAAAAGFMYFQHYQVRNHPRPEAAAAWSAGEVLLEAIRLANSTDPQAVATQFMSLQMHTVFGNVSFDHTGYSTQPTSMMQFSTKNEWMAQDQLIPDLRFLSGPGAVPLRYPKPPKAIASIDIWQLLMASSMVWCGTTRRDTRIALRATRAKCPAGTLEGRDATVTFVHQGRISMKGTVNVARKATTQMKPDLLAANPAMPGPFKIMKERPSVSLVQRGDLVHRQLHVGARTAETPLMLRTCIASPLVT